MNFAQVIASLRFGYVEKALTDKLAELVAAAKETGKKGELTLKITVSPHGKANREIQLTPKITTKTPPDVDLEESTTFFVGRDGGLTRDDPEQVDMFKGPRGVANGASPAENARDVAVGGE